MFFTYVGLTKKQQDKRIKAMSATAKIGTAPFINHTMPEAEKDHRRKEADTEYKARVKEIKDEIAKMAAYMLFKGEDGIVTFEKDKSVEIAENHELFTKCKYLSSGVGAPLVMSESKPASKPKAAASKDKDG